LPLGERKPGVYWLRLLTSDEGHSVAVATEVPGNPAMSVTNAISRVADYVMQRFQIRRGRLRLYQVWPRGCHGAESGVKYVSIDHGLAWRRASRREIETIVGLRMPVLPSHSELYARVLALGGGVSRETWRPIFEAVDVGDLPPPHRPFQCAHAARFETILNAGASAFPDSGDAHLAAGREFLNTLTAADLAGCRYHQADWKPITNESVRIVEALGEQDTERYVVDANHSYLTGSDRRGLVSLLTHPIDIRGGGYTDGQHRACALRFSGAARAAVVVREALVRQSCEDWVYAGVG
jgi:hypothetical protein